MRGGGACTGRFFCLAPRLGPVILSEAKNLWWHADSSLRSEGQVSEGQVLELGGAKNYLCKREGVLAPPGVVGPTLHTRQPPLSLGRAGILSSPEPSYPQKTYPCKTLLANESNTGMWEVPQRDQQAQLACQAHCSERHPGKISQCQTQLHFFFHSPTESCKALW